MISPTDIIISSNERGWKYRDVYRLNTRTGAMQKVLQNSQEKAFTSFIFDNRGQLRGAISRKDLNKNIYYRKGGNFPMEKVLTVTHPDKLDVVGFTPNNRDIYILSNVGRNTVALQIFNPQRKKVVRTLFSHPKRNVTGIAYAPDYNQLLYATYRNSIGVQRKFFNSPTKRLYREAERKIPSGSKFSFVSFDRRRNKYIVLVYNDRTSAYYTYHRREKNWPHWQRRCPGLKRENSPQRVPSAIPRGMDGTLKA